MRIVATAGHVDHGKSALVHALTGAAVDRLVEERRRGLTIDLGFAWTRLDGVGEVAFVDVPGHVDFIRNMIAGVAVVDAALLVVDAREGWREQTHQHLHVLRTVGVGHVVAAVTKADLVDAARLEEVLAATGASLGGAGLVDAPVVACDAISGSGLDRVRAALAEVLAHAPPRRDLGRPRLWIDRSFTVRGAGTVVTGGLGHGSLAVGDQVCVVTADGSVDARVRGIESLGESREVALTGGRTALNLARVDHRAIRRGDAVVSAGDWHLTDVFDAELEVGAQLVHGVTRRGAFTVHLGTTALAASLRVIGGTEIGPGERGPVRIRLPRRLPLVPGDRYVLAETGRAEIVGGGEVLDVDPVLPVGRARPDRSTARVVAERGAVAVADLARLTGEAAEPDLGRWVVDPAWLDAQRRAVLDRVAAAGPTGLALDAVDDLSRAIVERLHDDGELQVRGGMVRPIDARDDLADHPFLARLRARPFQPPEPSECGVRQPTLMEMRRRGLITSLEGLHFATSALDDAARRFADLAAEHPGGVTVAQFRDALGTTRKWAMPILAHLDARGVSRRTGEVRVAGPLLVNRGLPS